MKFFKKYKWCLSSGALFGWWAWHKYSTQHPDQDDHSGVYMLSSTVSSAILHSMAKKEGFSFEVRSGKDGNTVIGSENILIVCVWYY